MSALGPVLPFAQGVFDSTLALPASAVPALCRCDVEAWDTVGKILLANVVLVLAQAGFVRHVITPAGAWWAGEQPVQSGLLHIAVWLPGLLFVYIFTYTRVLAWYQNVADALFRHSQKLPAATKLTRPGDDSLSGLFLWLFLFVEMQVVVNVFPMLTGSVAGRPELVGLLPAVQLVDQLVYVAGAALSAFLYGWYSFEPFQISQGMRLEQRVAELERHWLYYVGFGLPFVVAGRTLPYFVNLALFLCAFPFLIAQGALLDPHRSYRALKAFPLVPGWLVQKPAPVFFFARKLTLFVLRLLRAPAARAAKKKKE